MAPPVPKIDTQVPSPVDAGVPMKTEGDAPTLLQTIVINLTGGAEVQRAGSSEWVALKIGDAIRVGDQVRTSDEGGVALAFGKVQLHVQEGSNLKLSFLGAKQVRASVEGQVEAESGDDSQVAMEAPGGAVAQIKFGRAVLHTDGTDAAMAVIAGKATLHAGDSDFAMSVGDVRAVRGKNVRSVRPPRRAALEVAWPEQKLTNKAVLTVQGRSGPWTRVFVQGERVKPDDDGQFKTDVKLHRGAQRVRVIAVDVLGHRTVKSEVFTLDPDAPNIQAEVQFK